MKWAEILKRSFEHIKKYRFLWFLGILATLTESGIGSSYSGGSGSNFSAGGKDYEKLGANIVAWIIRYSVEIAVISVALFAILLLILYISYASRAGLIHSIDKIESGREKVGFSEAFHFGQKYFWRLLGLIILIGLIIVAVVSVLVLFVAGLVMTSIFSSLWLLLIIIPLGLLAAVAIIVFVVYLSMIMVLAFRGIVIKNYRIIESIRKSRELIHHNLANVLIAWLIQLAIGVVAGLAIIVLMVVAGGVLFGIGFAIYSVAGTTGAWIYGAIAAIALLLLSLLASGIANAYISTFWTLVYKKLNSKS